MTLRVKTAWELYISGLTPKEIAAETRSTICRVNGLLRRAKAEAGMTRRQLEILREKTAAADAAARPRCRCGLLLPCLDCVPPLHHFAARRL